MDLETFWFCLIALLWGGYFLLEGFDFGVGMLLPFVPRDEGERGVMFQTIGPVWDGNEVWLVVAGGATFAAFPAWYGTMFSGFYIAFLLLLLLLIVRVVSFEWRSKSDNPRWRNMWMWVNAIASAGIALIWGIGLANLLHGVPLDSNGDFTGTFWDLFSPYTVFAGVTVIALFAFHGATFLTLRATGAFFDRVGRTARVLSFPALVLGVGFLATTVGVAMDRNDKELLPPVLPAAVGIAALLLAALLIRTRSGWAFAMTALGTVATVVTLFTSLYPRVMVSDPNFGNSLTVDSASSAHYTLAVMSVVALIVVPLILLYQGWTYHVFRQRLEGDEPGEESVPELSTQPEA